MALKAFVFTLLAGIRVIKVSNVLLLILQNFYLNVIFLILNMYLCSNIFSVITPRYCFVLFGILILSVVCVLNLSVVR